MNFSSGPSCLYIPWAHLKFPPEERATRALDEWELFGKKSFRVAFHSETAKRLKCVSDHSALRPMRCGPSVPTEIKFHLISVCEGDLGEHVAMRRLGVAFTQYLLQNRVSILDQSGSSCACGGVPTSEHY